MVGAVDVVRAAADPLRRMESGKRTPSERCLWLGVELLCIRRRPWLFLVSIGSAAASMCWC